VKLKQEAQDLLNAVTEDSAFMMFIMKDGNGQIVAKMSEQEILSVIQALTHKLFERRTCCEEHFRDMYMALQSALNYKLEDILSETSFNSENAEEQVKH